MPRKKNAASTAQTASSRTSATIFNGITSPEQLDNTVKEESSQSSHEGEEPDLPEERPKFPFSLVYDFQDLLNAHLTLEKGVQVLVCLYISQIFYIHLQKQNLTDVMSAVGFNILSGVLSVYLSHRSLVNKHKADPDLYGYPSLPSFNIIYSFFIPYSFIILLGDPKSNMFYLNLSLTAFAVEGMHPIAKVMSAYVYTYMFGDHESQDTFQFMSVVWIYLSVELVLTAWNQVGVLAWEETEDGAKVKRTMDVTEVHLAAIFMVNLFLNFHVPVSESTLPMHIVRILAIAFVGAYGASYPVYLGYGKLQEGRLRDTLSYVNVTIFAAVFYVITNYLFQSQVYEDEVVSWLLKYILSSESRRFYLEVWLSVLAISVPTVSILSSKDILSMNQRRKFWHFALVASVAYPALIKEPTFTAIALFGSIFIFIFVEFLRCSQITFVGRFLHNALSLFQDEKDLKGPLSLSYIYLVVGVAIPIAYGAVVSDLVSLRSYLGLVTLGLGDSIASIIGGKFGKTKWSGSSRTVVGTVTHIIVTFTSFLLIDFYLLPEANRVKNWENVLIVAFVSGLIEGAASLNDNFLVPCMALITYELLNHTF